MHDICLFAGTSDGRHLADRLKNTRLSVLICVATEYGETLVPEASNLTVHAGRLNQEQMAELFCQEQCSLIVDATHPFAVEVTKNIKEAASSCGVEYIRLIRPAGDTVLDGIYVESVEEAANYLEGTSGNILATTGSKELLPYTKIADYQERLYVRLLPMKSSLDACESAGIKPAHIIAMQGPFTEDMNRAQIRMTNAKYLVTKESGTGGGFFEKIKAAREEGVIPVIIGRPVEESGMEFHELLGVLRERFHIQTKQRVCIVGLGMGAKHLLTEEAKEILEQADCIIGAKRAVDAVVHGQSFFYSMDPGKILEFVKQHPEYQSIAVVMTGDTGFFSGTKKLLPMLAEYEPKVIPGISSLQYLCAKLGVSWDDAKILSLHGREGSVVPDVTEYAKVFVLVGGAGGVKHVLEDLQAHDLGKVEISVGERLSYPEERIITGTTEELINQSFDPLSVLLIRNHKTKVPKRTACLPDEAFLRSGTTETKVPMTKAEVRAISVAKLKLDPDSVVYDIGAGTGSVSVEMAGICTRGHVYAVECKPEAVLLANRNKKQFGLTNVSVVEGTAPEACESLPKPTHAFVGGTSGNMYEILSMLLTKNPNVRIVINLIALESIAEAVRCMERFQFDETEIIQISVAKARKLGRYHLMNGQNPIYVITCQKHEERQENEATL